jgi:OHCU decarboxylase
VHLTIAQLNQLPPNEVEAELLKCCGSRAWASQVVAARPFARMNDLLAEADRSWWSLPANAWLEAFHSHPKIGETKAAALATTAAQKWSREEQSGTRNAAEPTMAALAELNRVYEQRFGFIFIVCASGKTSDELLALLDQRLKNEPQQELRNAAAEQAKITQLRLRKLLDYPS